MRVQYPRNGRNILEPERTRKKLVGLCCHNRVSLRPKSFAIYGARRNTAVGKQYDSGIERAVDESLQQCIRPLCKRLKLQLGISLTQLANRMCQCKVTKGSRYSET